MKNMIHVAAMTAVFALTGWVDGASAASYNASLSASPASYSGSCPAKITFNGSISADKAGKVQYRFVRSDGAFAPIQTLDFAAPGSKPVSTTWTLGGASLPSYSGWQAIEIVYPASLTSAHANFSIKCEQPEPVITGYRHSGKCVRKGGHFTIIGRHFDPHRGRGVALGGHGIHVDLPVRSWSDTAISVELPNDSRISGGQWYYTGIENADHSAWLSNISKTITVCPELPKKPDLTVRLIGPTSATPGEDIGHQVKVVARNIGDGPAPGTMGAIDPGNGYMIDLVLSTDTSVPAGYARYDASFHEDVLLRGGRYSNTHDLAPGASRTYQVAPDEIPSDVPAGNYFLCAHIDPGSKVAESNEGNNVSCARIKILPRKVLNAPQIKPVLKAPNTLQRSFK